jgi:hypothetical protein
MSAAHFCGAASDPGQPFRAMESWLAGRLRNPLVALPTLVVLIALTHVAGTAAMSSALTKDRRAASLLNSAGRPQFEQCLSHVHSEASDDLGPPAPLYTSTERFAAKQLGSTMTNPTSTQLLEFLHKQRDLLAERQGVVKSVRKEERMLLIADRGRSNSGADYTFSSDDTVTVQRPSEAVLAIYARPQLQRGTHVAPYRKTCNVCNNFDPRGICEGSDKCLGPNSSLKKIGPAGRRLGGGQRTRGGLAMLSLRRAGTLLARLPSGVENRTPSGCQYATTDRATTRLQKATA